MLISLKWLSHWVDLTGITAAELVQKLSVSGLEVASVTPVGEGCDSIVVGQIQEITPHPKADRLVICRVDVGQPTPSTIVCGAKNMVAGDCVPVALPGSQPPGIDFEIVTRKVMGVESCGMLCAKEELALAESSDGLWILPPSMANHLGEPIFKAMDIADTILEIEVTPNRPDALCHRGVARDVAALFGRTLRSPEERLEQISGLAHPPTKDAERAPATLVNPGLGVEIATSAPVNYAAAAVDHFHVQPSDESLQLLLAKVGLRPVNNMVDLTNFVMFDIGQPMHAFDRDVSGMVISVRNAVSGESFQALNHKDYSLCDQDVVISNPDGVPLALAGVMGGLKSEVTSSSSSVLLECAYFGPVAVRKTAKRYALHSDSSHRYERGMDSDAVQDNLIYALQVAEKFGLFATSNLETNIVRASNITDAGKRYIDFHCDDYERLVGEPIEEGRAHKILTALGLGVEATDGGGFNVLIPGFRPDLERPVDLVEELLRVVGVNTIPGRSTFLVSADEPKTRDAHPGLETLDPTHVPRRRLRWISDLRQKLFAAGLLENVAYSFMAPDDFELLMLPEDDQRRLRCVEIANPLTSEQSLMRTTMLPAMLNAAKLNAARQNFDYAIFEIGRTYERHPERPSTSKETSKLSLFASGLRDEHFSHKDKAWDFFDLKGLIEDLFYHHDYRLEFRPPQDPEPFLHPYVQASIVLCPTDDSPDLYIGHIGRLHPKVSSKTGSADMFFAELDLGPLEPSFKRVPMAKPLPKFQAVSRDFAFVAPQTIRWSDIESSIQNATKTHPRLKNDLQSCRVFDVYEGEQVEIGFRSIAIGVVYQACDKTLTDDEIAQYDQVILDAVNKDLNLTLRS